ncbi:MAG: flagellar hook-length control protein FliK, partial [Planctomycetota bacterium]
MKVASTLTITVPDATGLPSLLSSEADLLSPSLGLPALSVESPTADSVKTESVSSFDAVLAMFGLPQNLPLQTLPNGFNTGTPAQSASEGLEIIRQFDPSLARRASFEMASNNTVTLPLDLGAESPPPIQPVPSVVETVETVSLAPATVDPTTAPVNEATAVSQVFDVPKLLPTSTTTLPEVREASQFIPVGPSLLAATGTDTSTPRPTTELPPPDAGLLHSPDQKNTEPKPPIGAELPRTSGSSGMASEFTLHPEIAAMLRRFAEPRHEASEEKPLRHRQATADGRPTAELTTSISHATEMAARGPNQLDSRSLAEQLATALQIHCDDLSAGKPIELHLRLDPPELGMVRVHLRLTDDAVSVRFIAGDEAVTRMLESQLPDLRQSLAERGLAFAQCDVTCDSRQQQSSNFGRENEQPSFARIPFQPRAWLKPAFVSRSVATLTDRIDV